MKNKKNFPFVVAVCIIIVVFIAFLLSDKRLDLESEQVSTLYKYLGEVDIYRCGGLNTYSDKTITKGDISEENTLCMAYYNIAEKQIKSESIKASGVNKNDIKICKVGESTTLATNNDEDRCDYKIINKDDLNEEYSKIYGEDIENYNKFYISSTEACFLEGDKYYCGTAETFTYSLTSEATIYRLLNKAIKKLNGDIVIYDYFLKVSDNKCYSFNNSSEENEACSIDLKKHEVDIDLVKEHGTIYKHTFEKDSNGEYHWVKSELK